MRFEWDPAKAAANVRNHRVKFEEAAAGFDDPKVLIEYDSVHSTDGDERRLAIGWSVRLRFLAVSYTVIDDETIRIISARRATKAEGGRYADQS